MEITQAQLNNAQSLPGPRRLDYLDTAPEVHIHHFAFKGEGGEKKEEKQKKERGEKMDKEEVMEEDIEFWYIEMILGINFFTSGL